MKVTDKRSVVGVCFDLMVAGEVYRDPSGFLVLATDEDIVVNISDGVLWRDKEDYPEDAVFTFVEVQLELL